MAGAGDMAGMAIAADGMAAAIALDTDPAMGLATDGGLVTDLDMDLDLDLARDPDLDRAPATVVDPGLDMALLRVADMPVAASPAAHGQAADSVAAALTSVVAADTSAAADTANPY